MTCSGSCDLMQFLVTFLCMHSENAGACGSLDSVVRPSEVISSLCCQQTVPVSCRSITGRRCTNVFLGQNTRPQEARSTSTCECSLLAWVSDFRWVPGRLPYTTVDCVSGVHASVLKQACAALAWANPATTLGYACQHGIEFLLRPHNWSVPIPPVTPPWTGGFLAHRQKRNLAFTVVQLQKQHCKIVALKPEFQVLSLLVCVIQSGLLRTRSRLLCQRIRFCRNETTNLQSDPTHPALTHLPYCPSQMCVPVSHACI